MADINPMLLQYLARMLGPRLKPEHLEGALLAKGAEAFSKGLEQKGQSAQSQQPRMPGVQPGQPAQPGQQPMQRPPSPPQSQAGGQVQINKQVPGAGPLRSGTSIQQLQALVALLANPMIAQQMARMPPVQPNMASPQAGLPGVPGFVPTA